MKIIKQELQFEECLKQRIEFICEFSKVNPTFIKCKLDRYPNLRWSVVALLKEKKLDYSPDVIANLSKEGKIQICFIGLGL